MIKVSRERERCFDPFVVYVAVDLFSHATEIGHHQIMPFAILTEAIDGCGSKGGSFVLQLKVPVVDQDFEKFLLPRFESFWRPALLT